MAKHVYPNRFFAHLTQAITSIQTTLSFYPEEIAGLLTCWNGGAWLYLVIMDSAGGTEIVKMTGLSCYTLTVERGQGGTTARAFPMGSVVASRLVAEHLAQFLQKGVHRSGDYNPNGTLTGLYPGEKFYQTGPAVEQKRWWINADTNRWRLLAGSLFPGESMDEDGFIFEMPNWVDYSNPQYWVPTRMVWDGDNQWWITDFNSTPEMQVNTYPPGGGPYWYSNFRPSEMMIMVMNQASLLGFAIIDAGEHVLNNGAEGAPAYWCYEVQPIAWQGLDLSHFHFDARLDIVHFRVLFNIGFPEQRQYTWEDRTDPANWTVLQGSWNGSAWDTGELFYLELEVNGAWGNGYFPNKVRITADIPWISINPITVRGQIGTPLPWGVGVPDVFTQEWFICNYNDETGLLGIYIHGTATARLCITKIEFGFEEL